MQEIQTLRNRLERQKGAKAQVEISLSTLQTNLTNAKRSLRQHEQAREIIREVGIKTQQELSFHIADITSLALDAVFENPYRLCAEFLQRRNKTECDLYFVRDGMRVDPLTASGVGAVDVATFALRIASWSMANPRSRATIILDEPFRYLSENYQERASMMLKEISEKLGIQLILITHEMALTSSADKVFEVSIRKGKSIVKEV